MAIFLGAALVVATFFWCREWSYRIQLQRDMQLIHDKLLMKVQSLLRKESNDN